MKFGTFQETNKQTNTELNWDSKNEIHSTHHDLKTGMQNFM
jgi:hypothetical protein